MKMNLKEQQMKMEKEQVFILHLKVIIQEEATNG